MPARLVREPVEPENVQQAYLLARKSTDAMTTRTAQSAVPGIGPPPP